MSEEQDYPFVPDEVLRYLDRVFPMPSAETLLVLNETDRLKHLARRVVVDHLITVRQITDQEAHNLQRS